MIVPSAKKIKDIFGDEIIVLRTMGTMDMVHRRCGPLLLAPFALLGTGLGAVTGTVAAGAVTSGLFAGMSTATLGLMGAGAGMSALSSIMGGQAAKEQAEGQAKMMEASARAEKVAAQDETNRGKYEASRTVKKGERTLSTMSAGMGQAGVTITGEGAPVAALGEQKSEIDLESEMIGYNAAVASGRHKTQAGLDIMQSKIYKQKGKNEEIAGWMGAGSSLLTGLTLTQFA